MLNKITQAKDIIQALEGLSSSAYAIHRRFSNNYVDYLNRIMSPDQLISEFENKFEIPLRAVLFDLNDVINLYAKSYGNYFVGPILEEMVFLQSHFKEIEAKNKEEMDYKIEGFMGQIAEEKYRSQELSKREHVNQRIQKQLEYEIKELKKSLENYQDSDDNNSIDKDFVINTVLKISKFDKDKSLKASTKLVDKQAVCKESRVFRAFSGTQDDEDQI